jgi:hypothetical protein
VGRWERGNLAADGKSWPPGRRDAAFGRMGRAQRRFRMPGARPRPCLRLLSRELWGSGLTRSFASWDAKRIQSSHVTGSYGFCNKMSKIT